MTSCPTCIVYVTALETSPVIRTWNIGTTTHVITSLFILFLGLLLVAFLATVPEIKIQIATLGTIPLSALLAPLMFLPRPGALSFLLKTFFMSLLISIRKYTPQLRQLRLNQPRDPLHHIHWRIHLPDTLHHIRLIHLTPTVIFSATRPSLEMSAWWRRAWGRRWSHGIRPFRLGRVTPRRTIRSLEIFSGGRVVVVVGGRWLEWFIIRWWWPHRPWERIHMHTRSRMMWTWRMTWICPHIRHISTFTIPLVRPSTIHTHLYIITKFIYSTNFTPFSSQSNNVSKSSLWCQLTPTTFIIKKTFY